MFRKKLRANEQTDHSIENKLMHVVFAHGQEHGNYVSSKSYVIIFRLIYGFCFKVHAVPSGVETGPAKNIAFYQRDELKFHGHASKRGFAQINFFDGFF
jgi:AAA+ superfamily predicted ATPase